MVTQGHYSSYTICGWFFFNRSTCFKTYKILYRSLLAITLLFSTTHKISFSGILKGQYTLGDKLQQHVAATRCSDKSLHVYWRIFVKIFVAATEFVAPTSCTDSVWFDFLQLVAAKKFFCGDKNFHKNSPVHTKRFGAATCRLTLLLQLVTWPVHTEWSVAATCCSNLSLSVYRP